MQSRLSATLFVLSLPILVTTGGQVSAQTTLTYPDDVAAAAQVPSPSAPIYPKVISSNPTPQNAFNPQTIDRDLYAHQKVGKRYTIMGKSYIPKHDPDYNQTGIASWYGPKFHGKPTASGEIYNMNDLTAAHKTLPLNSMLWVTNIENGKSILVRLNDRGPFVGDRIIDLSAQAAKELDLISLGKVRVQYAGPADPMASSITR